MALRNIEQKIEGVVEKTFGRMFRSTLQPVELARRLAREMEDHKTVSVSRVYVPNQYTVYLSPADRRQFSSYESALVLELGSYLEAHARSEGLSLLSMPRIRLETDSDLRPGEFGPRAQPGDGPLHLVRVLQMDHDLVRLVLHPQQRSHIGERL